MGGGLASAQRFIRCALAKEHQKRKGAVGDYGEGSGEERPRAVRQPTNKDPTAFRGGGRGRGLLVKLRPSGGAEPTSPVVVDRAQDGVTMGRVRGRNDPEQCASRQKRTQPLLGVVVGVGACWRSCAHGAVLSRQAP